MIARLAEYLRRWRLGTRAACEAEMRRLTNGERGCESPAEHVR